MKALSAVARTIRRILDRGMVPHITLAFKENAFVAPVVKHQEERQQAVIDTGVYARVRHPMYSSVVLLLVGMAL